MVEDRNNISDSHEEDSHDYPIAKFDFDHVSLPFIVTAWLLIVGIIKTLFHLSDRITKIIPESCLLIILGIFISGLAYAAGADINDGHLQLDSDLFFLFLLPPIVFDAGYFMPLRPFFENLGSILLYAVVGTLMNTVMIGALLYLGTELDLYDHSFPILKCFLFSALISAVDPVAVLAVFEEIHVNEVLYILVFGESLLNDAVTVVLYHMMETFVEIGEDNLEAKHYFSAFANFLCVSFGGISIGLVLGFAASFLSKYTNHVRTLEPIFVFAFAYFSYLIAELFHFSGILAIVCCGLFMAQYVELNISHKSHTTVKYFLKMLASISESIIFLFLGLSTVSKLSNVDWSFLIITLVACFICRFFATYFLTFLANFQRKEKLDFAQQFIMAYGGIRGAVAFCLAASLDEDVIGKDEKNVIEATTLIVIFFTVFIQGISIGPLVKLFHIKTTKEHEKNLVEIITFRVLDHSMTAVEDIIGVRGANWLRDMYEHVNDTILRPLLLREKPETREIDLLTSFTKYELNESITSIVQQNSRSSSPSNLKDENGKEQKTSITKSISDLFFHGHYDGADTRLSVKSRKRITSLLGRHEGRVGHKKYTEPRHSIPDTHLETVDKMRIAAAHKKMAAHKKKTSSHRRYLTVPNSRSFKVSVASRNSFKKTEKEEKNEPSSNLTEVHFKLGGSTENLESFPTLPATVNTDL